MDPGIPPADHRTRQRLLEAAQGLLSREGLSAGLLERAAGRAACPIDRARVLFPRDEDVVLAFYARFASDLEARVEELPEGGVARRFRAAMEAKFGLMEPYRPALAALLDTLLDARHELGVLNPQTEIIRARVQGVFAAVVLGADDRPSRNPDRLARALYAAHLVLVLRWCRTGPERARAALALACGMLDFTAPYLGLPLVQWAGRPVDALLSRLLEPADKPVRELAAAILRRVFRHRRLAPHAGDCAKEPCGRCLALHAPKAAYFVRAGRPVAFVLPAFPAKSPSRRKTLGPLPDRAEEQALEYLHELCADVERIYPPGMRISLCSDGHVFSDAVGVSDGDVTAYGDELRRMIRSAGFRVFEWFDLSCVYDGLDYPVLRDRLVADYGRPIAELEARIRRHEHARALFNGIHRFLYEERLEGPSARSKSKVREECRTRALQVIQRSEAWGRLLADCFPAALRLSIHPQGPHAEKIGILLGPAQDAWITPWHGVAARTPSGWTYMKRSEAEAAGGKLVERDGRPSHFEMSR